MEHDNPLYQGGAIAHAGDAFLALGSPLQEPSTHGAGMRHAKSGAKIEHEICEPHIAGEESRRSPQDGLLHSLAVVLNTPCPRARITYLLSAD
jgi:hypothetical protein